MTGRDRDIAARIPRRNDMTSAVLSERGRSRDIVLRQMTEVGLLSEVFWLARHFSAFAVQVSRSGETWDPVFYKFAQREKGQSASSQSCVHIDQGPSAAAGASTIPRKRFDCARLC